MPLSSRVSPFGELFAHSARGTMMGNRGGRLHDAHRKLGTRRWSSKQWICCKLDFNGRRTRFNAGYSGGLEAYQELSELTRYNQRARLTADQGQARKFRRLLPSPQSLR